MKILIGILLMTGLNFVSGSVSASTFKPDCLPDESILTAIKRAGDGGTLSFCLSEDNSKVIYRKVTKGKVERVQSYASSVIKLVKVMDDNKRMEGYSLDVNPHVSLFIAKFSGKDIPGVVEFQYWAYGELMATEEIPEVDYIFNEHESIAIKDLSH